MIGTVRSLADRMLERLVPSTRAEAAPCSVAWELYQCPGNPYPTTGLKQVKRCGSTVTVLQTLPCGTSICGGYGRYGDFTPWYPCPCVNTPYNTCP
ncbi:hypothetical protein AAH991_28925 [Microbispora sp. ZYX-F-249]|uniref:Uncharacterized protein n=1 Tax=Microbispora maris TaxID=3144104 RepID=A0ABV0AV77_9ACTN